MKVFVVMGNDYPGAVFSTEELAQKFINKKKNERNELFHRIYWRPYEFELDKDEQ